jgi:transposase
VSDDFAHANPARSRNPPDNVIALRTLLLHREDEHAAELTVAHNGLKEQVLRNEQLKLRLAKLLRERFGASSEKLRSAIEQLELILGGLEEQGAQATPPTPDEPAPVDTGTPTEIARAQVIARDAAARCGGTCRPLHLS